MNSRERFEAWASERLPTLYLAKTDQGTYESMATGSFFAAWSARNGEIAQLKATVANYEMGLEAAKEEIARLKRGNEGLRAMANLRELLPDLDETLEDLEVYGQHSGQGYRKLKDWYRKVALACKAIDAANGGVEPDLDTPDELKALRKDAERYRWMRDIAPRLLVETPLIAMCTEDGSVRYRDHGSEMLLSGADADSAIDATMSKGEPS